VALPIVSSAARTLVRRLRGGGRVERLPSDDGMRWLVTVGDVEFTLADVSTSTAVELIVPEIGHGAYGFDHIRFRPGDVVLDAGAHVGAVSIYLAKRFPLLRIIAYEPTPPTFETLMENLRRNGVHNVVPVNLALSGDGRELEVVAQLGANSGGSTASYGNRDRPGHTRHTVPSVTLDRALDDNGVDHCALLKIDIEGGEHEVLLNTASLGRIAELRGEFHENSYLRSQGYSIERLIHHCSAQLGRRHVRVTRCQMAEG
jgi:FkbM family methyltransferase